MKGCNNFGSETFGSCINTTLIILFHNRVKLIKNKKKFSASTKDYCLEAIEECANVYAYMDTQQLHKQNCLLKKTFGSCTQHKMAGNGYTKQTVPIMTNDVISVTSNNARQLFRLHPSTSHL